MPHRCRRSIDFGGSAHWGYIRQVNRSVLDLGLAHGMANIVLFIIIPNWK